MGMKCAGSWAGLGLLAGVMLLTSPALAQVSLSTPDEEVIVKARPDAPEHEVRQQAQALSRMEDLRTEPLARFQDKVCPGILGLPLDAATLMVDRIRYDAERVGLELANDEKCVPNILIAFVRNGQAELQELKRKRGYLFSAISVEELRELTHDAGPVHAWSSTVVKTRDGVAFQGREEGGSIPTAQVSMSDSRIFLANRRDISYSIVAIDIAAINGMSVVQIADYAAMRALARTRPAKSNAPADTILSLFDGPGPHPFEWTNFDLAYMRSLYGEGANLPAYAKIAGVSREMQKGARNPAETGDAAKP